jgi:hypothetical protein
VATQFSAIVMATWNRRYFIGRFCTKNKENAVRFELACLTTFQKVAVGFGLLMR